MRDKPASTAQGKVIGRTCSISSSESDHLDVVGDWPRAGVRVSHGFCGTDVGAGSQRGAELLSR